MVTWEIVKKLAPRILATLVIGSLIWWVSHTSYNDRSLFMTGDKK